MRDKSGEPISFGLVEGMSGLQLLYELADKGIGGETRQEIVTLLNDAEKQEMSRNGDSGVMEGLGKIVEVLRSDYLHSVDGLEENGKFAIIRYNAWKRNNTNTKIEGKELYLCNIESRIHYLAGINDENKYFLRPLDGIAQEKLDHGSIREIVDWVNRKDQGFQRIQGDLLIKLYPYQGNKQGKDRYFIPDIFEGYYPQQWMQFVHGSTSPQITRSNNRSYNLGEHIIRTDGNGMVECAFSALPLQEPVIVDNTARVVLEHPQHATVSMQIPQDHYAVIVSQRGRQPIQIGARGLD